MTRRTLSLATLLLGFALAACGGSDNSSGGTSAPATPTSPSPAPAPGGAATSSCSNSVTGVPVSVPGTGGRYTLNVSAGATCAWSIQSDAAWAAVSPGTGQGSGTTLLVVEENLAIDNSRSANLTFGSQVIHFSQANGCTYRIDQTTADVGPDGNTFGISLSTRDGCTWKTSTTEKWVRAVPTSGEGSDLIHVEVDANTGGDRHATMTIAGQRVVVTQRGR
jgi:hypothetical protein